MRRNPDRCPANKWLERHTKKWQAGAFVEAAELFLQAADLEHKAALERHPSAKPDSSICARARAGFCFAEARRWDRARPLLWEAIRFDWLGGRLWNDRGAVQKSYFWLLKELSDRKDGVTFRALFHEAVQRVADLDQKFPSIRPNQELLLQACIELKLPEGYRYLADLIESERNRLSASLKKLLDSARCCADGSSHD